MMRVFLAVPTAILGLLVAAPVLLLGLPFWGVAWLTRQVARMIEPTVIRWPEVYEFDASLGWRGKAYLDCHVLEERDDVFRVVTDQHGWPGSATVSESQMIVFGDSFAWGYGVNHAATFLRVDPRLSVKGVGAPGYNLVQEVLLMEQMTMQLKGKLVCWLVYVGNDLFDNLSPEMSGYRAPFVRKGRDGNWEIIASHLGPEKWRTSVGARARGVYPLIPALHSDTFLAERAYEAADFLLAQGARVCQAAGAKLVVISIPSPLALDDAEMGRASRSRSFAKPTDPDLPDRRLGARCSALNVPFVPLKQHLLRSHYKPHDDHWTEAGHRRVAEVLHKLAREQGCSV